MVDDSYYVVTYIAVEIIFDPVKREGTLRDRGLDFADADSLFDSRSMTVEDDRQDYGERRTMTFGWLHDRAVAMVWTERDGACRVISMRHMHRWEIEHVGLD